jgi:hypothetical protein
MGKFKWKKNCDVTQTIPDPTPTLKTEAASSSEMLVSAYKSTRYHSLEDHSLNSHHHDKLRI